jgi:hypothetical protein
MDKDLEHVLEYLNGPHPGLDAWVASEKAHAEYLRLKAIGDRATKIGPLESFGLHVWPGYKEMVDEFQQYQRRKSMQITMQGKYQTRDGRAVRILAIDRKTQYGRVVAGLVTCLDGKEEDPHEWLADGKFYPGKAGETSDFDLVPIPTKHEKWGVMVHSGFSGSVDRVYVHDSLESAQSAATRDGSCRVVKVSWEE